MYAGIYEYLGQAPVPVNRHQLDVPVLRGPANGGDVHVALLLS